MYDMVINKIRSSIKTCDIKIRLLRGKWSGNNKYKEKKRQCKIFYCKRRA